MAAVTFDTLKFVTRLEKAGIPREQAAAIAEAQAEALGDAGIATKRDVSELRLAVAAAAGRCLA